MNGYLVLWVHTMDDIPCGLFASKEDAMAFVAANPIDIDAANGTDLFRVGPRVRAAWELHGTDASTPLGYRVVGFKAGVPVSSETAGWVD